MSTKRWIHSESAEDELGREVLRAGLDEVPPEGAERQVWRNVAAVVVAPAHPGVGLETAPTAATVTSSSAGGGATFGLLAKGFVLGVGATALVVVAPRVVEGGFSRRVALSATTSNAAAPPGRATVSPKSSLPVAPASSGREPSPGPRPAVPAAVVSRATPVAERGPPIPVVASSAAFPVTEAEIPNRQSRLAVEALSLQKARSELRAGSIGAAFATLEASRQEVSAPELDQEREALTIELLYRSGQLRPASARARAFLERYRESPHASRVRSFLGAP